MNSNVRSILVLIFLFLFTEYYSQKQKKSLLYKENGRLVADSSLQIKRNQLLKWKLLEDSISLKLIRSIKYEPWALESGFTFRLIYSLKVDKNGNPIDIVLEKYSIGEALLRQVDTLARKWLFLTPQSCNSIDSSIKKQLSVLYGQLKSLYDSRQPNARYYFPYNFKTFDLKQNQELVKPSCIISLGWIALIHPRRYYEEPYRLIEAPKGVTCTVLEQPMKAYPKQKKKHNIK